MSPKEINAAFKADWCRRRRDNSRLASHRFASLLVFSFLAFTFQFSYSQPVVIQLKDKISGMPVEYAYVTFRQMNGPVEDKQITDIKGEVFLKTGLPSIVEISCVGYKDLSDTILTTETHIIDLSPDYYQLDQVVVTGQFRPQPVDKSIYKIRVIDNRQFQLKAASNVGDLLKNDLSFQYRSEGVMGDFIRIRGLSGEYVKILLDGMPITGRLGDQIDLGQLTLNNVDHIEVIEGPMSVIYGSSALAGAINIITSDNSGKKYQVQAGTYYESIGTYNANLSLSANKGNHTFSLNGARNFFSGWGPVDTARFQIWKPKLQYLAGFGYQYHKKNLRVICNTDYLNEELRDLGTPAPDGTTISAQDGYHYTTRLNSRANFSNTFNDVFVLNLQGGYSYYQKRKITYVNDLVNLEKTIHSNPDMHDTTTFQSFSARGFVSNIPGKKYEYQTGFDMNYESALGKRTAGYQYIADYSGFMNFIYRPLHVISIQPGIRVMYNSDYKAPLIYAFNVKFTPHNFTLRASYAKGFRAPSLKQLYLEFIDNNHHVYGNKDLQAETANNASASVIYNLQRNRHDLNIQLDLFYNAIENAIALAVDPQRPGYGMYFNVDGNPYKTKGAEFKVGYRYSPSVELNAGVIRTGRSEFGNGNHFVYSTDWVSSATYRFEKYKTQVAVFYKYTDAYLDFAGNFNTQGQLEGTSQQYMSGYHTLDLTVSKDLFENSLNISAGCKNIFNVMLVNSFGSIDPHNTSDGSGAAGYGRTFFFSLRYRFTKL
jgi:outer membrane receptor for ferrienterochelin and colicins